MKTSKKKINKIIFVAVYALLSVGLLAFMGYGLWHLWGLLDAYQKAQPDAAVSKVIEKISTDKMVYFDKLEFTPNEFEDRSYAEEYFEELMSGTVTFTRNGKLSNEQQTVYTLKKEGKSIASLTVKPEGTDLGYGYKEYVETDIKFGEVATGSYSVIAPDDATVYCNGKEVDKKYITSRGEEYEGKEHFFGLVEHTPYEVNYTIEGFIKEPLFTAKDKKGNELELKDGKFTAVRIKDDDVGKTALEFSKCYSKFIERDDTFYNLSAYLVPDTDLYKVLSTFNNSWPYLHSGYDFKDAEVSEPLFYNEKAVMIKIKFDYVLYGVSSQLSQDNELHLAVNHTVYLIKEEDGGWKVIDLVAE